MSHSHLSEKLQSHSSQQDQQSPVCTWSAHAPQSGLSKSPFPRREYALSTTPTAAGELFLFGGFINNDLNDDLYVISTRDFSTTLLQASAGVPSSRGGHRAALTSTHLLIWGGKTDGPLDVSLHRLNLVSREWTRIVPNGPGPSGRYFHTVTVVGSKFFVFGGNGGLGGGLFNDMWALDLNSLKPVWESYEPTPGNEKPPPRCSHVSVATEDHIIVFGGYGSRLGRGHYYNDTWSFNISTRKWVELQCTGSIPSARDRHAAVLVDDAMYVYGESARSDEPNFDDLCALQLSTKRWFKLHNEGTSPLARSGHAMASDGTRVFVLGGHTRGARSDEASLIHVFDTKHIKYPEPERNAVDPNELSALLAERDHRIAQLTDELALKSAPLEQAKANAVEEDQVTRRLMERVRAMEAQMTSMRLNERKA